jgi:hypothetical protein
MLAPDNTKGETSPLPAHDGVLIGDLLAFLAEHAEKPLVFTYEGAAVKPGYHVTEVKAGRFSALDCGAKPEAWSEIFIQLWDVDESAREHMLSGKFATIIRKVAEHVALDPTAKLTFEVSDGVTPMQLHKATMPRLDNGRVLVEFSPRAASCKPRDRWLFEQTKASAACCGGPSAAQPCCG